MTRPPSSAGYFVEVRGTATEHEDDDIPGVYELSLPADYPQEAIVSAILDEFHSKVGIAVLDDFDITVIDSQGNVLIEHPGAEAYSRIGSALFLGMALIPPDPTV